MAKERFITGVDIGSSTIKVLVAGREPKTGDLELVSQTEEISDGVRRGTIVSTEKVSNILRDVFLKISQELGQNINSVYVNVNGSHIFSKASRGLVSVSRADQKISEEDLQRVLQEASTINVSSNKEIFEVFPRKFIIDGEEGIKDPIGLKGVRLEAEVLALGGFSPYLGSIDKAILEANLNISDKIPSVVAAARAVLTEKQKELGVALLDMGAGITSLAVFEEGSLIHLSVLPMGSNNITNDIAIALKTDIEVAERIKTEYGSCVLKRKEVKRKINTGEDVPLAFSQKMLIRVVSERVSEIFEEANKELKKISKEKLLPAGVVLTGGGAKLPNILELAKSKFHLPVRLGKPKGISGLEDDLSYAVACGLVLSGAEQEAKQPSSEFFGKIFSRLKKFIKIFIP